MLVLASNKNIELKEIRRENRTLTQETETYDNVETKKFRKRTFSITTTNWPCMQQFIFQLYNNSQEYPL
jgi:hypothetical protein